MFQIDHGLNMLRLMIAALFLFLLIAVPPGDAAQYLWQTNSAGNDIHVYDVETFNLVKRFEVGPEPHGIAAPDDGSVVYVSIEANGAPKGELLWVDPRSFHVRHRMAVGPEPHAIATTPDGRWVYVPCRDGHYWVVDARSKTVVTRIYTGGRPHNTQAARDGRYVYLSPMGRPKRVTIVDIAVGHSVVGHIPFGDSVRPPALSADQAWLLQHVDGLNGFQVANVGQRRVVATIAHTSKLGRFMPIKRLGWLTPQGFKRCHGLAIRPDQQEIWSVCAEHLTVHALRSPDFPERHTQRLSGKGYWLTFSPDSRYAFIALKNRQQVAVVDAESKAVIRHLEVGQAPKRNLVITLPYKIILDRSE